MVQETIEAVKEAEERAAAIVRQAYEDGRGLAESARREAEEQKKQFLNGEKERMDAAEALAAQDREARLSRAMDEAQKEIAAMRKRAEEQSDEAVRLITEGLF